jgi:hypothetical protein
MAPEASSGSSGVKLTPARPAPRRLPDLVEFIGSRVRSAIWNKIGESLERQFKLDAVSIKADEGRQGALLRPRDSIGKLVRSDLPSPTTRTSEPADDSLGIVR